MPRLVASPRSALFSVLVYCAFFASGASSLFAEVTWNRMLIVVVGNSLSATAMITAVFMGGLGIGSHVAGRLLATRRASLGFYLALELAIGAYILASPALFELLATAFSGLAVRVPARALLTAVRVVVTMAALLVPALLMGATFPAMISGAESASGRTTRIGLLYGINTLGAAVGCFVAGHRLVFEHGVQATLVGASLLNVAAAGLAFAAGRLDRAKAGAAVEQPPPDAAALRPDLRRFLAVATFGVGFVALAYEVLLTRLVILFIGNRGSVFAFVLTGFLIGTGISAVLGTWLHGLVTRRTGSGGRLLGVFALAAAALLLVAPYVILSLGGFSTAYEPTQNRLLVLAVISAPTVALGALLPIAVRMLDPQDRGRATRDAATLYALNTAGGVLGAGLVNHFLVPVIGAHGVLVGLASICVAVAMVDLLAPGRSAPRWAAAGAVVAVTAVLLTALVPSITGLYADKVANRPGMGRVQVRLALEGRAANVTVVEHEDERIGAYRDMYLNGVEEASTRFFHVQLFKLLGALPVMVHPSAAPKDALVIAFGAGITAGSVLASDEVSSLDVVDLNPDVRGINDLFTEVNGDVFHQPRFRFHADDGRNYLVTSGKPYDVIVSDSTHPRAYDSWILYTQEFYRSVKARLRPGGVFAQWFPVDRTMRGARLRILLNTFRSVFPTATLWHVYGSDQAFLLATPEPFLVDARALQAKLDGLPPWFEARRFQLDTVARVAGFFWLDEPAMARLIGEETRVNTDDRQYFEDVSVREERTPDWELPRHQASALPHLSGHDEALGRAVETEQRLAQFVARYVFHGDLQHLLNAYCVDAGNENVQFYLHLEFGGRIPPINCQ
ncbi:MAG: fused MFS/spermidine synthase [Anaeromyxobacter sp.]